MLFQPTNIIPDVRTGIGLGVVDASQSGHGMQVSWQVNGDYPVMTAFRIVIYANNAASTQLYDTLRLTTGCPFSGRTPLGEVDFFSYTIPQSSLASAGITNGNEYKMVITQYYMDGNQETSITQSSASVFLTRDAADLNITIASVNRITAPIHTFVYQLYPNSEHLDWIRYQITAVDSNYNTSLVYDSGSIFGAVSYECTYGALAPGRSYRITATGQTQSGMFVQDAVYPFTTEKPSDTLGGTLAVRCSKKTNAVFLNLQEVLDSPGSFEALAVYREQEGNPEWVLIDPYCQSYYLWDFGVPTSAGPFRYHVFGVVGEDTTTTPPTPSHVVTDEVVSSDVNPIRAYWSLLACTPFFRSDTQYSVDKEYQFANNLSSGSFTNNNEPNVMQNFTAMPTVQLSPSNYKSGSLTALIGKAEAGNYSGDTLAIREELMALSTSMQYRLFLKSPKGDVMEIALNGPVSAEIADTIKGHPQTVTVPWVEIGNDTVSLCSYFGDLDD